jgi:antitoxin (DNA-binding transcriptional repressor) of toxin-antitoxin stability system
MTASITDLRRRTSDVVDAVKRGESVDIEMHGKSVATMEPSSDGIPAGVLLDALLRLDPDPETADEIERHILDLRKSRASDE